MRCLVLPVRKEPQCSGMRQGAPDIRRTQQPLDTTTVFYIYTSRGGKRKTLVKTWGRAVDQCLCRRCSDILCNIHPATRIFAGTFTFLFLGKFGLGQHFYLSLWGRTYLVFYPYFWLCCNSIATRFWSFMITGIVVLNTTYVTTYLAL